MKFLKEEFPLGTFKRQKTDGGYLHDALAANLNVFAKKISDDMHFLIIITGNDSVGNGKTTIGTQVASYLTWKINKLHGINNTYTADNEFFNANSLIQGSPKLPKMSVVKLDEGDDLTTHGMKELAVRLKRYFRKCRQLNQIVILVLPSFFELPKFFALSRSHCLINVKFMGEFERGYFDFYGGKAKKLLYLRGKKEWDYDAYPSSFEGDFAPNYYFFPNVEEESKRYLVKKHQDMVDDAKEQEESKSLLQIEKEITIKLFRKICNNLDITQKELAKGFGVSERTGNRWMVNNVAEGDPLITEDNPQATEYNNILVKNASEGVDGKGVDEQEVGPQNLNNMEEQNENNN